MMKTRAKPAQASKSTARPRLDKALAGLERELKETQAPAGTAGPIDSPLLLATANLLLAYVRWQAAARPGG